jgi:aminoglycoside phosphotransferase (APT) family kinase protein
MSFVPRSVTEIDPPWLTEALQARCPGVRVESVRIRERAEVTNSHVWLEVRYSPAGAPGPERLFCKLLPEEGVRREAIAATGMGLREAKFYGQLAAQLSLRVPTAHVVRYDEPSGAFVVMLEDLAVSGCTVSTGPESPTPDAAASALEDLAAMHVHFEHADARRREAPWVSPPGPPSDYGSERLAEGLANHRERLSPAFAEMAELYVTRRDALHEIWGQGVPTLIHGDCHIGNLFFDGDRVGFLDWGMVVAMTSMRDVSYFLSMGLSVDDRRRWDADLIRHYLDVRRALKGEAISFDEAWRAHRVHAAYLAPASCQIVTFPEDVTEKRRRFAAAFLERASAAIEDLESRAALRRFYEL